MSLTLTSVILCVFMMYFTDAPRKPGSKSSLPAVISSLRTFSVHALVLLGELTATLLDMVYRSEEKDKVVPFLIALLQNVFPYLKHHR